MMRSKKAPEFTKSQLKAAAIMGGSCAVGFGLVIGLLASLPPEQQAHQDATPIAPPSRVAAVSEKPAVAVEAFVTNDGTLPPGASKSVKYLNYVATTTAGAVGWTQVKCLMQGFGPDPDCNPGAANPKIATAADIAATICNPNWKTDAIRPNTSYTNPLKYRQMIDYGYAVPDHSGACMRYSNNPACYEEDHIVSLEDGGDPTSPLNLFPEPYYPNGYPDKSGGARQKDKAENEAHRLICAAADRVAEMRKVQGVLPANWASLAK